MLPYAAYLRVYEPVTAFPEPARTLWTAYADSRKRPRRVHALRAEHLQARRRLVASPPVVAPERESADAYVRRSHDMLYICPWETRLRSWHAFSRFRQETSALMAACYMPPDVMRRVEEESRQGTSRPHILSSTWHVPPSWFALFTAAERCLLLGGTAAEQRGRGPATAAATRTLIYVTTMAEARTRVEAALPYAPGTGHLETVARWLAAFHPRALVELDYGGLVHLLDDDFLRADESVAETGVALAAAARGEAELATAMRRRLRARWRHVRALESAN
ncbi:hypothetical protein [Actinomadura rugatobispora]|uniref:DUF8083 domain-containing protein n=1 Tax=Actinomadura rugatobispora TaxID=1994 RepID=A0ABW1A9V6_9ACTN|nr:hypothetical protein GCM10010200_047650 [Actinomadura rugatobispora]